MEALLRESGMATVALPAASRAGQASAQAGFGSNPAGGSDAQNDLLRPLSEQVADLERRAIAAAMAATQGNKLAASRLLGIARATLYQRLENPV